MCGKGINRYKIERINNPVEGKMFWKRNQDCRRFLMGQVGNVDNLEKLVIMGVKVTELWILAMMTTTWNIMIDWIEH